MSGIPIAGTGLPFTKGKKVLSGVDTIWEMTYLNHPENSLLKRDRNKASKLAGQDTLRYWHANLLPRHFEQGGEQKYKYQRRTPAYRFHKRQETGGTSPIIWSGDTRAMMMGTPPSPTGTANSARLRLVGPRYISIRRKGEQTAGASPDLVKEISTINQPDATAMGAHYRDAILERMRVINRVTKKVIR